VTALERRCRRLLRAYPAAYRRERGEEILGTLLENTPPDRRWPSWREGRALVSGGLRVRSGLNQLLTVAANLRLATVLGLVLMLLRLAAHDLTHRIVLSRYAHIALPGTGYAVAYLVLTLAVVAAAFFAPRPLGAALPVVTAGLWLWGDGSHGQGVLAAVVLVMVAIVGGRERLPRLWLWLAGALLTLDMLPALSAWGSLNLLRLPLTLILWVILGSVALWIAVDPRPAVALALCVAGLFAGLPATIVFGVQPPFPWQIFSYAAGAALAAAAAIWRLRRQAVP